MREAYGRPRWWVVGMVTMDLLVLVVYRVQNAVGCPASAIGLALASVLVGAGMGALLGPNP